MNYSIIITYCCKRVNELSELLSSIESQTLPPAEIVIVTDGPADEIKHHSNKLTKIYNHKRVKRPAPLRNFGLTKVKHDYVFITDDDDVWSYRKAELQLDYIIKNKADLCFCKSSKFYETESLVINNKPSIKNIDFNSLLLRNNLVMSSCLINYKINPDIKFPEPKDFRGWEDWFCWLNESYDKKKIILLCEKLVFYRKHIGSIKNNFITTMLKNQFEIIPSSFSISPLPLFLFYLLQVSRFVMMTIINLRVN